MNTLVIEPVPVIREDLSSLFEKADFTVNVTGKASEGLYNALQNKYQIITCNAWSNDTSGLMAIREIRQRKIDCPILMYSARGRWQDMLAGYLAGADDYIGMPEFADKILLRAKQLIAGNINSESVEELVLIRKRMLEGNSLERLANTHNLLTQDDREWSPQEVENEWVLQEKKRLERRETRQKAQAFLFKQNTTSSYS